MYIKTTFFDDDDAKNTVITINTVLSYYILVRADEISGAKTRTSGPSMYIPIYIYIYMYVCICIHTHIYMYIYMYIDTFSKRHLHSTK